MPFFEDKAGATSTVHYPEAMPCRGFAQRKNAIMRLYSERNRETNLKVLFEELKINGMALGLLALLFQRLGQNWRSAVN